MKWNRYDTYRLFFLIAKSNLKIIELGLVAAIIFVMTIAIQPDTQELKAELTRILPNFILQVILYFEVIGVPILTAFYTSKIIAQKRALEQQPEDEESTTNNNQ